jgi:protein-L-isoaspartate(D-aspartate) O-methyltransferase
MAVLTEPTTTGGHAAARRAMIDSQLRVSGITDTRILAAMASAPREDFVPPAMRGNAYVDRPLPLPGGKVLNPPLSHARLLSEARPTSADRALLIGEGYLAALLAPLVGSLDTAEGPAAPGRGPYSLIVIDGAIEQFPDSLAKRLGDDGRVVCGLIERGVSRLAIGRKAAGTVAFATLGEVDLAPLAEFAAPRAWSF